MRRYRVLLRFPEFTYDAESNLTLEEATKKVSLWLESYGHQSEFQIHITTWEAEK